MNGIGNPDDAGENGGIDNSDVPANNSDVKEVYNYDENTEVMSRILTTGRAC